MAPFGRREDGRPLNLGMPTAKLLGREDKELAALCADEPTRRRLKDLDIPAGRAGAPEGNVQPGELLASSTPNPPPAATWPPPDGHPYMPSNGTEGMGWMEGTCDVCEAGRRYREAVQCDRPWTAADSAKDCQILGNALAGEDTPEWLYKDGRAICTAFVPERTAHERDQDRLAGVRRSLERQGQCLLFKVPA